MFLKRKRLFHLKHVTRDLSSSIVYKYLISSFLRLDICTFRPHFIVFDNNFLRNPLQDAVKKKSKLDRPNGVY